MIGIIQQACGGILKTVSIVIRQHTGIFKLRDPSILIFIGFVKDDKEAAPRNMVQRGRGGDP